MSIKRTICLYTMYTWALIINAQFLVNGHHAVFDESNNTYLISIPSENFNSDYLSEIILEEDSLWTDLSIENTNVNDRYTFKNIEGNKKYVLEGKRNGVSFRSYITFTSLPIINLKGDFGYDYANGSIEIMLPTSSNSEYSLIKAKWRGGSTNLYDRHKRNYKIKTLNEKGKSKDISFLGLREDNNWILDAGQIDMFRLRNRIATEIWQDMATKPYYANKEPKAQSAVNGKVTEVILNHQYVGIYSLTETLDRKQMKLKKYDSKKQEFHGMLWKASSWGNALFWGTEGEYDNTSESWNAFEVKYPDIEDVCPTDYSLLYQAIDFVATSDDNTFRSQVDQYFDIPVLIDYYIFLQLTNAVDNTGKNMYWAIYDQAQDKKMTLAVWDLDATVGNNWETNPLHPDYVKPDNQLAILSFNIYNRLLSLNPDGFKEKVAIRYNELRQNKLSLKSLQDRYNVYYQKLTQSGATKREENRWSKDTDLNGNELNFEKEILYINQWIEARLAYLDHFLLPASTDIKNIKLGKQPQQYIYNIQGQRLNKIPSQGVYIINGKKYIK